MEPLLAYGKRIKRMAAWTRLRVNQGRYPTLREAAKRYHVSLDMVEQMIEDGAAWDEHLMIHARSSDERRGDMTFDILN